MAEENWKTIAEIDYEYAKDYVEVNAHGAYGGKSAANELSICFYEDSFAIPTKLVVKEDSKGQRKEELIGKDNKGRRILKARITIPMSRVQVIIDWMQKHLNESKEK